MLTKMGKDGQTQITQIKQQSTRQEKIFAIYTNEKGLCSEYIKNYYKPIRKGQTTFTIKGKIKIDKMPEEKHTGEKTHMTIKREAAKPSIREMQIKNFMSLIPLKSCWDKFPN